MNGAARRSAAACPTGSHPHGFVEPPDFPCIDPDPPLTLGAALQVIDRDRLAAELETAGIRSTEPIVERRLGNAQSSGSFVAVQ